MTPTVLVVDDEPLARERLRHLLKREGAGYRVEEAASGTEAIECIVNLKPDVVFLDVEMPEQDGFSVIRSVGVERMPVTVFVTAFERYAVSAFENCAIDYLLKPYGVERFRRALVRAERFRVLSTKSVTYTEFLMQLGRLVKNHSPVPRLLIKQGESQIFVNVGEIAWLEAQDNYVVLHVGSSEYMLRDTLAGMLQRLPSAFRRIHRSYVVNVHHVQKLTALFRGDYVITLSSGAELPLSRNYREQFEEWV